MNSVLTRKIGLKYKGMLKEKKTCVVSFAGKCIVMELRVIRICGFHMYDYNLPNYFCLSMPCWLSSSSTAWSTCVSAWSRHFWWRLKRKYVLRARGPKITKKGRFQHVDKMNWFVCVWGLRAIFLPLSLVYCLFSHLLLNRRGGILFCYNFSLFIAFILKHHIGQVY